MLLVVLSDTKTVLPKKAIYVLRLVNEKKVGIWIKKVTMET